MSEEYIAYFLGYILYFNLNHYMKMLVVKCFSAFFLFYFYIHICE